ncbi:hypothetical protein GH714_025883 [Hevea brasiliensis]|uniref:Pantoate--beta-alanine ligase n=1 Tax=Hevea brasiliensis TaxID=3981 RepID=A0A6A6K6X8_HEVBR|nr:hypothetical protein GH714_025883 [Hevea brasiliensis]
MEAKKQPLIITDKDRMRNWSRSVRSQGKTIALVPTMGYLHQGHISLVKEAHKHANLIVVSIYVNPGQFSPSEDLSTYPSDFHGDILKLMSIPGGVDVVFHPHNLYDYRTDNKNKNDIVNCTDSRDDCKNLKVEGVVSCVEEKGTGHETWVRDLDFSIRIIGSEVMRDSDGLAMSSRNVHLSPEEREKIVDQETLEAAEEIRSSVVFCVAAWFGKVRLIDNVEINI